jgi:type I restriction enzyme, S subunit
MGSEAMSAVEGWVLTKLGELGEVARGRSRHRPRYAEHLYGGPYPFIQTGDVKASGGRINSHKQTYSEDGLAQSRLWPAKTMCITIAANIAETGILKYPSCFPDSIIGFVANEEECDVYFIEYMFRFLRRLIQHEASGSVQDNINLQTLDRLEFLLPSLPEQKAIAHVLGSLDERIELNRRMNETLEAMAQALFKSWFVDFDPVIDNALAGGKEIPAELSEKAQARAALGDKRQPLPEEIRTLFPADFTYSDELGWIPKGWKDTTLKNGIELFDSKRIPLNKRQREEKKGIIPYYGAASIMDYVDDYLFDGVYILIGEDGTVQTDTGKPVLQYVWGKFWANNHAHVCLGKNSISAEQLYLLLQEVNIIPFVTGAVQPKLNQKNLKSIPLLLAPPQLNNAFKNMIEGVFGKIRSNTDSVNHLSKLRDTLLPKLLSGELRIPDAEKMVEELAL